MCLGPLGLASQGDTENLDQLFSALEAAAKATAPVNQTAAVVASLDDGTPAVDVEREGNGHPLSETDPALLEATEAAIPSNDAALEDRLRKPEAIASNVAAPQDSLPKPAATKSSATTDSSFRLSVSRRPVQVARHSMSRNARSPGPAYYQPEIWTGPAVTSSQLKYSSGSRAGGSHHRSASVGSRSSPRSTTACLSRWLPHTSSRLAAELAAESKARKDVEQARILASNALLQTQLQLAASSTDCLLDDEAAALRRSELAAESRLRRATEAAEAKLRNHEMHKRLKGIKAVTDDDITDEAAGLARVHRAAAAKTRRAATPPAAGSSRSEASAMSAEVERLCNRIRKGYLLRASELALLEATEAAISSAASLDNSQRVSPRLSPRRQPHHSQQHQHQRLQQSLTPCAERDQDAAWLRANPQAREYMRRVASQRSR